MTPLRCAVPICDACTRNAQTVDTPNVKVRVERCLVWRDSMGFLRVMVSCHHAWWDRVVPGGVDERWIETLVAFK